MLAIPEMVSSVLPVNALKIEYEGDTSKFKSMADYDRATRFILPDGQRMAADKRFWTSFCQTFSFSRNIFNLFDTAEVLSRLAKVHSPVARFTWEKNGKLLSCTNPKKPIVSASVVDQLFKKFGGTNLAYANGIISGQFNSPFASKFAVVGKQDSEFTTGYTLEIPLDGYGAPSAYLMLLRQVCTNGAVARSSAFRTSFSLGKDEGDYAPVLNRAFESFNDEEGYHAFRQRMEVCSRSWASLSNFFTLNKAINHGTKAEGWGLIERVALKDKLNKLAGDPVFLYGLNDNSEVSSAKLRSFPVKATLYDLINFATEVTTHRFKTFHGRNALYGWLGSILTEPIDLEESCTSMPDFKDFYIDTALASRT